jgi:hypothetical protein
MTQTLSALSRRSRWPAFGQVAAALSVLALMALCYMAGAAAMHFRLPFSGFFAKAFHGADQWLARRNVFVPPQASQFPQGEMIVDRRDFTCDGFTLCTTTGLAQATLIDMNGSVVHKWEMPARHPLVPPAEARDSQSDTPLHWERCHLYPNGDLLAVCCAGGDTPYGYGLLKIDRDSRLLWGYSADVHHALDVGEDGRIYTLTQKMEGHVPPNFSQITAPYQNETLVVLSPEGRELTALPLLEAFHESPYLLPMLTSASWSFAPSAPPGVPMIPGAGPPPIPLPHLGMSRFQAKSGDILHANSVKVLSKEMAARFPLFKPGQVLVSFRNPGLIAVVDLERRAVVWAAKGAWQAQHDAQFLDNGRILLFDNLGDQAGARVLEYDPSTQAVPWWFAGENDAPFSAPFRGGVQRLANGNTLIVEPSSRIMEVTASKEIVWQWRLPPAKQAVPAEAPNITGARRYLPAELPFLDGRASPRWSSPGTTGPGAESPRGANE